MQYHWRPHNSVFPLIEVGVLRTVEVSQDKDCLEGGVVFVCKFLDGIRSDAHGGVDVLEREGNRFIFSTKKGCKQAHTGNPSYKFLQAAVIAAIIPEENGKNMSLKEVFSNVLVRYCTEKNHNQAHFKDCR